MTWQNLEHKGALLMAPASFCDATPEQREQVCNGLGPEGRGWLVPDTILLLNCALPGDIHDWCYAYGAAEGITREQADHVFHANLKTHINAHSNWLTRPLRLHRAKLYYLAVKHGGAKHFNQNP